MATNTAVLRVQVLTDTAGAAAGMTKAQSKVGRFASGMRSMAGPAAVGLASVVALGKGMVDAASDTQQAMGGIDAVFKGASRQVKAFAATSADSVGLAASEYGDLATIIGSQLKNAGTPMDKLAGKTDGLIKLGADLAATYGGSTADAVSALSSALKGEMDPLERYGTSLSQTKIAARMAADGTDKLTGKQQAAAKQAATLALITEQTADAHGKFASEADTAAGQQARATAKWKDAQATLGGQLLPTVTKLTGFLADMATWVAKNGDVIVPVVAALAAFAAGILIVTGAMAAFNAVMALNPVVLVVLAIVALTIALVILWKRSKGFRDFTVRMWAQIRSAAAAVWTWLKGAALAAFAPIKSAFTSLKAASAATWSAIKGAAAKVWTALKTGISGVSDAWAKVKRTGTAAMDALLKPVHAVRDAFNSVVDAIESVIHWIGKIKFPSPPAWLNKVIPGGNSARAAAPAASPSLARSGVPLGGARAGTVINVTVTGVLDGTDAARKIRAVLRDDDRRRAGVQLRPARG